MTDTVSRERRSEIMRGIRSKGTGPEMAVRRYLHSKGYRYRLHHGGLPGKPDLAFPGRRKAVFVHGCFWHQHEGCGGGRMPKSRTEYWGPKLGRNAERDLENVRALKRAGWGVLTVWECELKEMDRAMGRVERFLNGSN